MEADMTEHIKTLPLCGDSRVKLSTYEEEKNFSLDALAKVHQKRTKKYFKSMQGRIKILGFVVGFCTYLWNTQPRE